MRNQQLDDREAYAGWIQCTADAIKTADFFHEVISHQEDRLDETLEPGKIVDQKSQGTLCYANQGQQPGDQHQVDPFMHQAQQCIDAVGSAQPGSE